MAEDQQECPPIEEVMDGKHLEHASTCQKCMLLSPRQPGGTPRIIDMAERGVFDDLIERLQEEPVDWVP